MPRMTSRARTTPPIIQPTGVELVVDSAVMVVDRWTFTVVGVTSVVGASVVVGVSTEDVVVAGSVVGVVVGGSVVGDAVVGTSALSVGAVVVTVAPPRAVVGADTEGALTDGKETVGFVALPPPPPLPHAAKSAASATSAVPDNRRSCRVAPVPPLPPLSMVTSPSSLWEPLRAVPHALPSENPTTVGRRIHHPARVKEPRSGSHLCDASSGLVGGNARQSVAVGPLPCCSVSFVPMEMVSSPCAALRW
jgi:hypothetical protein